jgi:antitoxin component YwqK of YwqJK toxin-antitoxin module
MNYCTEYESGIKKREGLFVGKKKRKEGVHIYYDDTGEILKKETYINGKIQ